MHRSDKAIAAACAVFLLAVGTVLIGGLPGDRPDTIRIVGTAWRADRPVPPLSLLKGRDPDSLAIRIPRHQLVNEIVLRTGPIDFEISSCAKIGKSRRLYEAELYTDGVPLDRDWAWTAQDSGNPELPPFAEVIAVMPREYGASFEGAPVCGAFSTERWGFTGVRSNAVRLPPLPGVGASGAERTRLP